MKHIFLSLFIFLSCNLFAQRDTVIAELMHFDTSSTFNVSGAKTTLTYQYRDYYKTEFLRTDTTSFWTTYVDSLKALNQSEIDDVKVKIEFLYRKYAELVTEARNKLMWQAVLESYD